MIDKFQILHSLLANHKEQVHPNVDLLISKPSLIVYIPKEQLTDVEQKGISVANTTEQDPIKTKSITAFFTRIPVTLSNTQEFLSVNSPVRISLLKIEKSKSPFKIFGVNFPGADDWIKLTRDDITKLCEISDKWYKYFAKSKCPQFSDIPHAAIYSEDGIIPAFACKILEPESPQNEKDFRA